VVIEVHMRASHHAVLWGVLLLLTTPPPSARAASGRPILAVFDFEVKRLPMDKKRLSELSDYFVDSLAATGAFQVVPRDQLKRRLTELKKKSYVLCYDQSCQVEIGRELAANKSLATRLMRIGRTCVVTATLYDLRKAATEGGATAEGGCGEDALRESLKRVVSALAGTAPTEGGSPAAAAGITRIRGQDPCPMVRVPAGPFLRGSPEGQGNDDEHPRRTIHLDAFQIDRHEVTVAQYRLCVRDGGCREPGTDPECSWTRGDRAEHPVTCVDWPQAKAYCAWVGKRLPSEAEWEKAARGASGRSYPWGEAAPSCQRAVMADGERGCGARQSFPVGSRSPRGDGPYGAQDMAGNVGEWVEDWFEERHFQVSPERNPKGPPQGKFKVYRGGSFQDDAKNVRAAVRDHGLPGYRYFDLGFRCARSR
jgi:formylglycine-generating enzyme required for sulfatase activity